MNRSELARHTEGAGRYVGSGSDTVLLLVEDSVRTIAGLAIHDEIGGVSFG